MHGIAFQCHSSRLLIAALVGGALSAGAPVRGELPAGAIGHAASVVEFSRASGGIGVVASEVEQVETAGRWVRLRKPWPADIDEWSHYLHGADGNPVAEDRVVGPPAHYQWIAGPRWLRCHETDSSVRTLVTSGGRLFLAEEDGSLTCFGRPASGQDGE